MIFPIVRTILKWLYFYTQYRVIITGRLVECIKALVRKFGVTVIESSIPGPVNTYTGSCKQGV